MRVLVVDDNNENIDMMMILLKSKDYDVISASNGQDALEKLHSGKFDLIISDILMPVMDGFQFCRECKKDAKLANICFVFYTATYIDVKDEEFALSLGARKFIRKPQEPDNFLNLIEEVIEQSGNAKNASIKFKEKDEKEVLKLYNERLIVKLEKKNLDLENEIASRKIAESSLKESEERFRNLFQNTVSVMLLIDPDTGQIIDANQSAEKFYGWSHQQLTSMRVQDINTLDEEAKAEMDKARIHKQVHFEFQHRLANGSIRNVEVFSSIIVIGGKEFLHSIIHDITERKQAEELFIASETRYRRLFESAKDGILILDAETGKIKDVNPFLIELLAYSNEQFLEKAIWEIGFFKDIVSNRDKFLELQKKGYVRYEDLPLETADGRQINVEFVSNTYLVNHHKVIQCNIRDITERKRSESALRESESRLREAQEMAHLGFWRWDVKTGDVEWSDEIYKIFRLDPNEYTPQIDSILKLSPWPEDRQRDKELIDKAIKNHTPASYEQKFLRPDQSIGYYYSTFQGNYDEQGNLISIVGTVLDITERKMAEQILIESEEKFNKAFQNSPDAIAITRASDGMLIEVNESFLRMSGFARDEVIEHSSILMNLWVSIQDRDKYITILKEQGRVTEFETRFKLRSGDIRDFMVSGELFILHGEQVILGIIRDITERKEAEIKLRENEERFRFVFERSTIGKSLTAPDGNLMRINDAFADMLGYSIEEMLQLNFADITHPDDLAESMECVRSLLANEQDKYRMEKRYFHKNGKIVWADVSTSLLRDGYGNPKYFITNIIDVTDKKKQELELIRAKEKAEESDKLKTAFLQNISHEIRTPLNGIIGFSDIITNPDLSPDKREKYNKIIRNGGNQLLSIIDDIISVATIEAGQEKLQEKETNINTLLQSIKSQNAPAINNKNISLTVSSALTDNEANILVDGTKLLQILNNLVGNAIKYTPEGYIKVNSRLVGNFILFTVEDTGIGIPPEFQEKIFDRFFQVDYSDTQLFSGTGLGLSIVKSYVHLLNGDIHLDSKPGRGTTFLITLPYVPATKIQPDKVSLIQKNKEISGKVILVADDDDTNYTYLEEILLSKKVKTLRATNGREAVELCKTNPEIKLVFMDIRMPELDGFEATRQILKFRKDLPIIAQTAYTFFNDKQKALDAGCISYLEKPLNPESVMDNVRAYM